MDKRLEKTLNASTWIVRAALGLMAVLVLGRRFIQNGYQHFWLDESLTVFIANHTPFTPAFFTAVKENISALPWPFIEYWAWLQALRLVPQEFLYTHLEYFLRFPLTLYSLIIFISSYLMVKRMSRSRALGLFVSSLIFLGSDLAAHLGSELRFHTSAMAHICVSWCALAYLTTAENNSQAEKTRIFILWIISGVLAGWSHLYGMYSLLLQIIFFTAANMGWVPKTTPAISKPKGVLTAFVLFIMFNLQAAYFQFLTVHPYSRSEGAKAFSDVMAKVITRTDTQIFIPSVWFWLVMILVFTVQNFIRVNREGKRQNLAFTMLILGAIVQLVIIFGLGFYYTNWDWGPTTWFGRYVMAGVVPFIFLLAYFARDFIPEHYDKILGITIAGVLIFVFSLNPAFGRSYWKHKSGLSEGARWTELRKLIKDNNAYGKITAVAGLKPDGRHISHMDVHNAGLNFTWQLYAAGPHNISPVTLYYKDDYAGYTPVPCAVRNLYAPAKTTAQQYVVDFCEQDKVSLRTFIH